MEIVYKTADGQEFKDLDAAKKHERSLFDVEKLKKDVKDLLNQIVILAEKDPTSNSFVSAVKEYSKRVLANESDAEYNEDQYYNSNCY